MIFFSTFFVFQQYFLIFRMRRAFWHTKWIFRIFLCVENFIYLSAHRNLLGLLKLQGVLCWAELPSHPPVVPLSLAIDIIRRMSGTCWHLGKPRRRGSCNHFLNDSTPRGQLGTSGTGKPPSTLLPLFGNLYVKLGSLRQGRPLRLVDSKHDFKQVSSASRFGSSNLQLRILLKHIRLRDKFIIS